MSKLVHLQCAAGNSRTSVSKSILILLLSTGLSLWNIHWRIFICKKRNKNHGEYSGWLECCAECSASLRSVIHHRQQPHKMREIIKGWLEDTSWRLPLGKTINAPPPLQWRGRNKRRLFPSGEGAYWSARRTTTKTASSGFTLYNLFLPLSLPHPLSLHIQGWATALFSSPP